MTEAQLSLLADTRLSARARFVGVFLSALDSPDDDGPEIPSDFFESFFGHSWDVLRRDVKALENAGWIERKIQTGKGHSPTYRFLDHAKTPPYQDLRTAFLHTLSDSLGENVVLKGFSLGGSVALNAPTSSSYESPPPPLNARAREFISESEFLVGTRDTLIDYLSERVDLDKQHGYVASVIGIIEGTEEQLWTSRDGKICIREGRAQIIAGCLNELRQSNEIGKYFTGPPGDIKNLRSKIRYRVKAETDAKRDAERKNARDSKEPEHTGYDLDAWKEGPKNGSWI